MQFQYQQTMARSSGTNNTVQFKTIPEALSNPATLTISLLMVVLILTILIGNIVIVYTIFTTKRLHTSTFYFVASLAVADFMIGVFAVPIALIFQVAIEMKDLSIFTDSLCHTWLFVNICFSYASVLNLCSISWDRYVAIVTPLRYSVRMNKLKARRLLVFVWIVSFCFAALTWVAVRYSENRIHPCFAEGMDIEFSIPIFLIMFAFPIVFLIFSNAKILVIARLQTKKIKSLQSNSSLDQNQMETNSGPRGSPPLSESKIGIKRTSGPRLVQSNQNEVKSAKPDYVGFPLSRNGQIGSDRTIDNCFGESNQNCKHNKVESNPGYRDSFLSRNGQIEADRTSWTRIVESNPNVSKNQVDSSSLNCVQNEAKSNLNCTKSHFDSSLNNTRSQVDSSLNNTRSQVDSNLNCNKSQGESNTNGEPRTTRRKSTLQRIWKDYLKLGMEIRIFKVFLVVIGVFLICWLPFFIHLFISSLKSPKVPENIKLIFIMLAYTNSACNVFIYGFFNRDFRKAINQWKSRVFSRPRTRSVSSIAPGRGTLERELGTVNDGLSD